MSDNPASLVIKCGVCNSTFSRQEHLSRHMRSHTREKPYGCQQCGKSFARLDVLHRHISSHSQPAAASSREGFSVRACREGALSRVRCSKGTPCNRCDSKGLGCIYPTRKKRKASSSESQNMNAPALKAGNTITEEVPDEISPLEMESGRNIENTRTDTSSIDPEAATLSNTLLWAQEISLSNGSNDFEAFHQSPSGLDSNQGYQEAAINMSAVNWLSPQFNNDLEWDNQLAFVSNHNIAPNDFDLSFPLDTFSLPKDSVPQESHDQTQQHREQNPVISSLPQHRDLTMLDQTYPSSTQGSDCSVTSKTTEGRLYVDGVGARAPFRGVLMDKHCVLSITSAEHQGDTSSTPQSHSTSSSNTKSTKNTPLDFVSPESYENIVRMIDSNPRSPVWSSDTVPPPSRAQIQCFVNRYFNQFHPLYPFLQKTTNIFEQDGTSALLLAVSAIGAEYCLEDEYIPWKIAMVELAYIQAINRISCHQTDDQSLWVHLGQEDDFMQHDMPALQTAIICTLWMLHSGDKHRIQQAIADRHHIVRQCKALGLLNFSELDFKDAYDLSSEEIVARWAERQAKIRTGTMTWLLDAIFVFEYNCQPLLQLGDMLGSLPCPEGLWENPTIEQILNEKLRPVSFSEAVEMLYIEKQLPPNLCQFGHISLIYAILKRTKEVANQYDTRLSNWIPNANIEARSGLQATAKTKFPLLPIVSKWRNSACDCLDILHWNANGTAANAGGWEHPTILHLHLSRLILLTPAQSIQEIAAAPALAAAAELRSGARYKDAIASVHRWAIRDQFKARLSLVHAGAVLWYVRRYSVDSFLEPFAIYMAVLVTWGYSVTMRALSHHPSPAAASSSNSTRGGQNSTGGRMQMDSPRAGTEGEEPELSSINLDRPCDDEMVQMFVRLGHKMSAHMVRVGNICSPGAARKILQEGVRLLSSQPRSAQTTSTSSRLEFSRKPWGIRKSFLQTLESLIGATTNDST